MDLLESLTAQLELRKSNQSYRQLIPNHNLIDFASNDYLGLARSIDLLKAIQNKIVDLPRNGATGSRLLSGNYDYIEKVETKLANLFNAEKALIFNSGYVANLALLSALPQRNDTIIYDELAHACIKDGARLSMAKRFTFRHNDMSDLKRKIKKASGKTFIAVESVYSMDGDQCPLPELVSLANDHGAHIILDEAHSTGMMGPHGSGLSGKLNLTNEIFARIYTFGKAMGVHGAAVAGNQILINYLINFARPFIYTTALPPHAIASIDCAFEHLNNHIQLQEELVERIKFFNSTYQKDIVSDCKKTNSHHAVQGIIIPGNDRVKKASEYLRKNGFDVRPVLSPTVKQGEERLRVCLHSFNSRDEISFLIHSLAAVLK